jgi:hypothetical protein
MTTIIDVINPMLTVAVAAEWLQTFEGFPAAVDLPVGWVIPAAMDKEANTINSWTSILQWPSGAPLRNSLMWLPGTPYGQCWRFLT